MATIGRVNSMMGGTPTSARGALIASGAEWGAYSVEYFYPNGGVFRLHARLGAALPMQTRAHWSDGTPAPQLVGRGTLDDTGAIHEPSGRGPEEPGAGGRFLARVLRRSGCGNADGHSGARGGRSSSRAGLVQRRLSVEAAKARNRRPRRLVDEVRRVSP